LGALKKKKKKKKKKHGQWGVFYIMHNARMLALNWTIEHILPQANF